MKKIQNLEELKKLKKDELVNEMLKGTIKGGSSCGSWTFSFSDNIGLPINTDDFLAP